MVQIRVERLAAGDVILYDNSSRRIQSIRMSTCPIKWDLLMEPVHGNDNRSSSLRVTIKRDRLLQATFLV